MTTPTDPMALLHSRSYVMLLPLAAVVGFLVSAVAYGFLALDARSSGIGNGP